MTAILLARPYHEIVGEQTPSKTACQFGWRGSAYRNWADQDPVK